MKVYVSGPITGMPDGNRIAFEEATQFLSDLGNTVVNPHILNEEGMTWLECMKNDVVAMMGCDEVAVLDGWEKSPGANVEVTLAHALGMKVYTYRSGSYINSPLVSIESNETILEEANRLVNGPRRTNYNHPLDNFTGIARLWSAYRGIQFTAEDVAILMMLTKINRESFKHTRDNIVDIAGYAQCLQMVIEERERREEQATSMGN